MGCYFILKHLRTDTGQINASHNSLSEERIINNVHITSSINNANKMNEYFSSVADILTKKAITSHP